MERVTLERAPGSGTGWIQVMPGNEPIRGYEVRTFIDPSEVAAELEKGGAKRDEAIGAIAYFIDKYCTGGGDNDFQAAELGLNSVLALLRDRAGADG